MRGENLTFRKNNYTAAGSSPRAWRKCKVTDPIIFQERFISTCVEKIRWKDRPELSEPVHLHVRGENFNICQCQFFHNGSSPRAWRKCIFIFISKSDVRFISTCVEKISSTHAAIQRESVHLHVRGENCVIGCIASVNHGSSPRAWRKFLFFSIFRATHRFISTCVEKIKSGKIRMQSTTVHLHVRGENQNRPKVLSYNHGSSPRAWRKSLAIQLNKRQDWFISTCVEKIIAGIETICQFSVHLHVRGENFALSQYVQCRIGSSPRAWRKLRLQKGFTLRERFISTCVEKILSMCLWTLNKPVHLHVRGENAS